MASVLQAQAMDEAVWSGERNAFRLLKRGCDVLAASAGLILSAPIFLLVALAVRLDTPGPIFFSQLRLGQGDQLIRIYKFRKFRDEPACSRLPLTLRADHRLTRVGAFLERTKLDELPQLWNVLLGNMSLVGPRPETLEFRSCLDGANRRILRFKPGLLGPSQYFFRNENNFYPEGADHEDYYRKTLFALKASVDLAYYENSNIWRDMVWIFRCMFATVFRAVADDTDWLKIVEDWVARETVRSARLTRAIRDETGRR
jgi:lipopolysaccharide/colanic/teichoic acid biosynthesis glycosyltransferase